jgi:hypothetical protein
MALIAFALPTPAIGQSCSTGNATFTATGEQCYQVPIGVNELQVNAIGASGGSGGALGGVGGSGAQVAGIITVTPGEVLYVEVGLGGGGTAPGSGGGTGGGESDVRTCSVTSSSCPQFGTALDPRLIVAGGGGGGGEGGYGGGGADGGFGPGGPSATCKVGFAGTAGIGGIGGGAGGLCESGGAGGGGPAGAAPGTAGVVVSGGNAGAGTGGGGGGGGYFGGGGAAGSGTAAGSGGGGGGGSSYGPVGSVFNLAAFGSPPSVTVTAQTAAVRPSRRRIRFPGTQPLHELSSPQKLKVANAAPFPLQVSRTLVGKNRRDFLVVSDGCTGKTIAARGSCTILVGFAPRAHGLRTAKLKITRSGRLLANVQLAGAA